MSHRIAFLAAVVVVLVLPAGVAQATFKGGNGRVAYDLVSTGIGDDGSASAYRALATVQPDGRADRFLRECQQSAGKTVDGDCSIQYRSPSWRRDGRQLVFDSGRGLALISSTGSGFAALPAVTADDSQPAFGPNGKVVFAGRTGTRTDLYVYDLRSRRAKRIVRNGADPDWSARGNIAFERGGSVYSVSSSGKGLRRVARGADPGWSASGASLLIARRGQGIYTVGAEGKGVRRVVRCTRCTSPVYSPNGRLIAYDRPGVTVARADTGRTVATLVQDVSGGGERFDGGSPAWAPR